MEFEQFASERTFYIETLRQSETKDSLLCKLRDIYKEIDPSALVVVSSSNIISRIFLPSFASTGRLQGFAFIECQSEFILQQFMNYYNLLQDENSQIGNLLLKMHWLKMQDWLQLKDEYLQWQQKCSASIR